MPSVNTTATSANDLKDWDKQHLWHAFTQMQEYEPLVFESAEGIWLTDIDGKRYLDGVSSLWCNVHGHRHPAIDGAIRQQLDLVSHVTLLGSSCSTSVRLAKRLVDVTPASLQHVFFSSDGASAVEAALKMAFQYWRQKNEPETRNRFMALGSAYHGDTIGSVSLGGVAHFHSLFGPLLFDTIRLPCPDYSHVADRMSESEATEFFGNQMRELFEKHHHETAAVIMEPLMQGAAGMLRHPQGMLKTVRDLCDEFNVLMIADEVAVGFGRTGTLFACQQESVEPDILCLGKGLTGGYLPLSATLANSKIWNAFLGSSDEQKTLFHGHTFGGNPLACAAALASMDLFESEQVLENMKPGVERLTDRLGQIANHPKVACVRHIGLMAGIELADGSGLTGAAACFKAREKNVLLRPLGDVIVVMPPLVASPAEIDLIMDAVEHGLA